MIRIVDTHKHHLLGDPFITHIDHQSIKYFMTQTKLSEKQMRCANFLSQFNFQFAHVSSKQNLVADALSKRPKVNAMSISYNHDLTSMIKKYATDEDFAQIHNDILQGRTNEPYSLNEGFLLHGSKLCIVKDLREKVMY